MRKNNLSPNFNFIYLFLIQVSSEMSNRDSLGLSIIIVGAIIGVIASFIMKGKAFSNLIIRFAAITISAIIGAYLGSLIYPHGFVGILLAIMGAIIVVSIISKIFKTA